MAISTGCVALYDYFLLSFAQEEGPSLSSIQFHSLRSFTVFIIRQQSTCETSALPYMDVRPLAVGQVHLHYNAGHNLFTQTVKLYDTLQL